MVHRSFALAAPFVLGIGLLAAGAGASTLITFEEVPGGLAAMTNALVSVPASSRLTTQYLASDGVRFSSTGGFAALVNHGAGNPTASIPNIIGGSTASGTLNYNEAITISFFDPSDVTRKATTDFFTIQGDWVPLGTGAVFAEAFDANGALLGITSDTDDKGFGVAGPMLGFNLAGIHSVRIRGNNGTVGFDNLEFGTLTAVPEPALAELLSACAAGLLIRARLRS